MDRESVIKIVKAYKEQVLLCIPDAQVYLYGSYAKNQQKEDSDIDIAVIVEVYPTNYLTTIPLLWKIRRGINSLIEPVLLVRSEPYNPLYETVLSSGIMIE